MVHLTALMEFPYKGRYIKAGENFTADEFDARLLMGLKNPRAERAPDEKADEPLPVEDTPPVEEAVVEPADLNQPEVQQPDLQTRDIQATEDNAAEPAARGNNQRYRRRDMRSRP